MPVAVCPRTKVRRVTACRLGAIAHFMPMSSDGAGGYAVDNRDGELFAVSRRFRHLGAYLASGSIDDRGCGR